MLFSPRQVSFHDDMEKKLKFLVQLKVVGEWLNPEPIFFIKKLFPFKMAFFFRFSRNYRRKFRAPRSSGLLTAPLLPGRAAQRAPQLRLLVQGRQSGQLQPAEGPGRLGGRRGRAGRGGSVQDQRGRRGRRRGENAQEEAEEKEAVFIAGRLRVKGGQRDLRGRGRVRVRAVQRQESLGGRARRQR